MHIKCNIFTRWNGPSFVNARQSGEVDLEFMTELPMQMS